MARALVIDDSSTIRRLLRRMLEDLGFAVDDADDGAAALDILTHGERFDVALVDWNMPNVDGLQVITAVRADDAYADMRILVVTSETEMHRMVEALEAGADEYLMKPFRSAALQDKLAWLDLVEPPS